MMMIKMQVIYLIYYKLFFIIDDDNSPFVSIKFGVSASINT